MSQLSQGLATAPARAGRDQATGRRFYVGVGVFLIFLSIAGFGPTLVDPVNTIHP